MDKKMETEPMTLPESFTPEQREELFQEIVLIYDHLDNVLSCVELNGLKNRKIQNELVTPFITQAKNAANILTAFYTDVAKKNLPITPDLQDTFEGAFRIFYSALDDIITGMEEKLTPETI
jgi:hypothetical protein